jgi:spermidine synthase
MHFETGKLIYFDPQAEPVIRIYQNRAYRWLMFADEAVQSAQLLAQPDQLALDYLQGMMAFLLFVATPGRVIQCGLGGGALVRFLARHWPEAPQTVIERHSAIIDMAGTHFGLPTSPKVSVLCADARDALPQLPAAQTDTLLVDIYDRDHPESNVDPGFLAACRRSLAPEGMAVFNTLPHDPQLFTEQLKTLRSLFDQQTLCLNVPDHDNILILAFAQRPACLDQPDCLEQMTQRATTLSHTLRLRRYNSAFFQRPCRTP